MNRGTLIKCCPSVGGHNCCKLYKYILILYKLLTFAGCNFNESLNFEMTESSIIV